MIWLIWAAVIYALFVHKGSYIPEAHKRSWPFWLELTFSLVYGVTMVLFLYCLLAGFTELHLLPAMGGTR